MRRAGAHFTSELLRRTEQLPGVRATARRSVPLGFTGVQEQVKVEAAGPAALDYWMNTVTPGYFELMHMPLIAAGTSAPVTGRTAAGGNREPKLCSLMAQWKRTRAYDRMAADGWRSSAS
jgi:hypothetical protein